MLINPFVFLVYALSGSLLGILTSAEPFIGSAVSQVEQGKYPYVVSVANRITKIPEEMTHICTGSLIANNFVLTNAFLLNSGSEYFIRVIVGSVDLKHGMVYNASMVITYNDWADSKHIRGKFFIQDIAIIKLSKKVREGIATPVALSYETTIDSNDEFVVLAGWGLTSENSANPSRYLMEAKVRILPRELCQDELYDLYKKRVRVSEEYMCTKSNTTIAITDGDSGGPVLRKNTLLGISVNRVLESVLNVPDGYAFGSYRLNIHISLGSYKDFITDVMKR